ncbi:MAG: hypothetical protein LBT99_03705, partial [Bifidobacteriaceae bacterium]|nr:hypothetical protein [Bifidobacteriaceae bacterium]
MAMHADRHKRSGDEFYTPAFIVERLALSYKNIFDKYNYIWLPFNSFDKPMYKVMKKYYGEKVIATKGNFFDVFHNNVSDILNIVNKYKVLVFDNPPFSKSIKIIKF